MLNVRNDRLLAAMSAPVGVQGEDTVDDYSRDVAGRAVCCVDAADRPAKGSKPGGGVLVESSFGGSIPAAPGPDPALGAYDVIEWHRENLALITNLPTRELPVSAVSQDRLPAIPLLAPAAGLIADFLRRWYGPGYLSQLRVVAEVDSIYYGLAVLRSGLVHGAMICAQAAAQAAIDGRLPGGSGIRLVPLTTDYDPPLELLAGIFARKGERQLYDATHPLNLLWNAFSAHATGTP
jgi:hypothetical protein